MLTGLEREFHAAMTEICQRSMKECRYDPRLFRQMIAEHGGLEAARLLLRKDTVTDGFTTLWERRRLDLTMEAQVLFERFAPLFTEEERRTARRRLEDYGYAVPNPIAVEPAEPTREGAMASRGSRLHLQRLVNSSPGVLNCLLLSASDSLREFSGSHPQWVSPLKETGYAEYQDSSFLKAVGLSHLSSQLAEFWPSGGPVWDGLACVTSRYGTKGVILLEAKSHAAEVRGGGCRATGDSLRRITQRLQQVKTVLGADPEADWLGEYYQSANRIAHLYFLNVVAQVPAWLVNLHFVGDTEQSGPDTVAGWADCLRSVKQTLALPWQHLLAGRVVTVFAPVE